MPVFHTKTIESILDPVAQQVRKAVWKIDSRMAKSCRVLTVSMDRREILLQGTNCLQSREAGKMAILKQSQFVKSLEKSALTSVMMSLFFYC